MSRPRPSGRGICRLVGIPGSCFHLGVKRETLTMAFASWWYATHGDKKTAGAQKPADKKVPATAEVKHGSASTSASAPAAGGAAGSSKGPASQERTMKPVDTKATPAPKAEPPKSTQTTKPKSTTTTSSAGKPSTGKGPIKQDAKVAPGKQKADTTISSGAVGKAAAASVVAASKPKDEVKEEKKTVSVDKVAAAAAPVKNEKDDALDQLIDSLGGPDDVPESPKFTGPEIADTPATSEYLEELGKRESTIPPEYRHLLDGKGDKPTPPAPKEAKESLGDDDLVAAFSSDFVSCQSVPEVKKPRLDKKTEAKSTSAAVAAPTQPSSTKKEAKSTLTAVAAPPQTSTTALSDDALDELLGTLEGPPASVPESPQYTGPEITETVTSSYLEELGKRESTIPPEYRNLLDGKDDGKSAPPAVVEPPPMSESDLLDEFSKDFDSSSPSTVQAVPDVKPKDTAKDKQPKLDVVVPSSASSVQAAAGPSADIEDALDELMGTLEGPEFNVPESPIYTGPEVTETSTAVHIEELGKRESTIPPAYRNLLDGKVDGKPVPPSPEEKPMGDSELADEFDKDFSCSLSPPVQQTPPIKPKDAPEVKEVEADVVVCASSAAVQAAPAPPKAPAAKADPIDGLAGTLGVRQEEPKQKHPVADAVKEKTDKEKREKLGEDEKTIPPDYRLKEVTDKDGKPILPKPEEKPQPMSEDDLLDALTEGFVTTPTTSKCAPLQSSVKPPVKSGSEETVSCAKASTVQSGAPKPSISDDALDLLSGTLGTRQVDPNENKPVVDLVKERAKEEHIDRLGDRDDTIPPEYRNLLDGKDQGKPAKPEEVKPKNPLDDDAAIGALSSDFASCDTSSTDKSQNSSKDKPKSSACPPVSKTPGKIPDSSKSTDKCSSVKPSAPKTSKS
ncbi:calpastatin isoform X2 [Mixophyes fleayi]|uniref:calpastatin isoform X2 n=1 Tax=Mixophyes fleayi TaxID=3061075 RepID=UPI003F4D7864